MNTPIILLVSLIGITSCTKSATTSETSSQDSATDRTNHIEATTEVNLYEQTDSVFNINGKKLRVNAKLFDLTEIATNNGDRLSRPTYSCLVKIIDANNKIVFSDSLLRDSWGYDGKIKPIDAYQITSPMLTFEGDEIILSFNVFEEGDAINGRIAFNINSLKTRYFWVESVASDE